LNELLNNVQKGFDDLVGITTNNHAILIEQNSPTASPASSPVSKSSKKSVERFPRATEIALEKLQQKDDGSGGVSKQSDLFPRTNESIEDKKKIGMLSEEKSKTTKLAHHNAFPRPKVVVEKKEKAKKSRSSSKNDNTSLLAEADEQEDYCSDEERNANFL